MNPSNTPHSVSFASSPHQMQQQQQQFIIPQANSAGLNTSFQQQQQQGPQQQQMQQVVYMHPNGQQFAAFPPNGAMYMMPQQQVMYQPGMMQQAPQMMPQQQQLNTSILSTTGSATTTLAKTLSSEEVTFAESLFLFCWAFISNMKEFILESSVDIYEHLFAAETNRKVEMLRRHKKRKAFFKRIKMEMGLQTKGTGGAKKSRSAALTANAAAANELNLSAISKASVNEEEIDEENGTAPGGASKLEALEQELMFLKQQLTLVQPKRKSTSRRSTSSSSSRRTSSVSVIQTEHKRKSSKTSNKRKSTKRKSKCVSIMNKENDAPQQIQEPVQQIITSSTAPPAPPLPPLAAAKSDSVPAPPVPVRTAGGPPPPPPISGLFAKIAAEEKESKIDVPSRESRPPVLKTMSFNDLIRQQQSKLKKTNHLQKKTTQKKAKEPQFCFQHELFAAIQNKFKSMHAANGVRQSREEMNTSHDSSDSSDSEGDWSSPKRKSMTPIRH